MVRQTCPKYIITITRKTIFTVSSFFSFMENWLYRRAINKSFPSSPWIEAHDVMYSDVQSIMLNSTRPSKLNNQSSRRTQEL